MKKTELKHTLFMRCFIAVCSKFSANVGSLLVRLSIRHARTEQTICLQVATHVRGQSSFKALATFLRGQSSFLKARGSAFVRGQSSFLKGSAFFRGQASLVIKLSLQESKQVATIQSRHRGIHVDGWRRCGLSRRNG
jgi:hypothetical protein